MTLGKIKYINVLIADSAASFCHYNNQFYQENKNKFISIELLREVISFSSEHGLYLNIIYGNDSVPSKLVKEINRTDHLKFMPLNNCDNAEECVVIVDERDYDNISLLPDNTIETIILRVHRKNLLRLAKLVDLFSEKCRKINVVLAGLEEYSPSELHLYEDQTAELVKLLSTRYKQGSVCEINSLSDRMVLREMNNCNAGIKHISFAPDGNFYLCPGFYYEKNMGNIGNIHDGINIKNPELLTLDKSPICRICDAYQCKRCIFLNKKMTSEINVPSYEQCVCGHIERNGTRLLISELKYSNAQFHNIADIGQLPYIDPFIKLNANKNVAVKSKMSSLNELPPLDPLTISHIKKKNPIQEKRSDINPLNEKDILGKIYTTQVEILKMLKYLRGI